MTEQGKTQRQHYLDENGFITAWPGKAHKRQLILQYLASKFGTNKKYSEPEVNLILRKYIDDYVTRRRDLVEAHLLERTDDGVSYWLKSRK
ncbi:DUF2087 domain-containing protein [Lactobacillus sp. ESL0731]|uniref:DUF2087 domain-containing protein n=1 Tax=unclassified Lactobacillus TaxID=2620435 RepID=UPI0023F8B256|nr:MULTISPECIES: DUF2087 domain-containing protein [unclassified Lactobacillus]WEV51123.1 DUF2087 domain-containing protein [Lactobacillus sp. ESL0700]WEV62252.1 DUF2087 domain-containing protein [Lactobacillus sp. ESL0731]